MTDEEAKAAFWAAVVDPDPSSIEIAQDIALEKGWKLWQLGEERADDIKSYFGHSKRDPEWQSTGSFWYTSPLGHDNGVEWKITVAKGKRFRNHVIEMFFEYQDLNEIEQWQWESSGIYDTTADAARAAARYAWYALKVMKQGGQDGNYRTGADRIRGVIEDRQPDSVPLELNPARPMDPKEAFWAAVHDPDEASTEIAQDIALGQGWKLADLGEDYASRLEARGVATPLHFLPDNGTKSQGAFYMKPNMGVEWVVDVGSQDHSAGTIWVSTFVKYHKYEASARLLHPRFGHGASGWQSVAEARSEAALEAWRILAKMKEAYRKRWDAGQFANATLMHRDRVPAEINPTMSKNPDDLAAARDKYKEFHRYDPKDVGSFPSSFTIPKRVRLAGRGKWVTYRSSKVDPSTLKKPRAPIDYIHEHDAGVYTYIKDDEPDTEVPDAFRDVAALVKLGECLGFCVVDADGEEVEAEGTNPLPELYTTPDGKCLFVIQGKREVLAMTWGGALGVYARGIDG